MALFSNIPGDCNVVPAIIVKSCQQAGSSHGDARHEVHAKAKCQVVKARQA